MSDKNVECTNQQRWEILSVKLAPQLLKKKKKRSSLTGPWVKLGSLQFLSPFLLYCRNEDKIDEVVVTWCFTPSQPLQLYQGDKIDDQDSETKYDSSSSTGGIAHSAWETTTEN